jgi:hypothetical protein
LLDDKIKIKCSKCSQIFRERAQKVRDGFQANCPHCYRLITFDANVEDRNVRKALRSARELRLVLEENREAAAVALESAPAPTADRSQY